MKKTMMSIMIALVLLLSAGCSSVSGPGCGAVGAAAGMPVLAGSMIRENSRPDASVTAAKAAEENVQETASSNAADTMPADGETGGRTDDEKLVDAIRSACATKAAAETYYNDCVVDIRTAVNPYDIEWDYGDAYTELAHFDDPAWDEVFDAGYYKETFPMLAMLYHDNDALLKTHFMTVGVHEGRQGCAGFNVKAFMDSCPDQIREAFGDNYACYYLYWMQSAAVDRSADVSGNGCPRQMTAVLTVVQREEFESINKERERLGVDPLTFDSELAAIANYRAWINADENWAAHDWAIQNNAALWDMVYRIGANTLSENTTSRFSKYYGGWYYGYAGSKPHYEAMVNTEYNFVGNSNVYACDNTLERYANRKSDTRLIHFDVFTGRIDTALNSK